MFLVQAFGGVVIIFAFFLVIFLIGGRAKQDSLLGKIYKAVFGRGTSFGRCCHWIFFERNPLMIVCFFSL